MMAGLDSKLIEGLEFNGDGENVSKVKVESLTPKSDTGQGDSVSSEDGTVDNDSKTCSSVEIQEQQFPIDSGCEGDEEVGGVSHLGERIGVDSQTRDGRLDPSVDQSVSVEGSCNEVEKGNLNSHIQSEDESNLERNESDVISSQSHQKPGVILLGRGNSFSLGRSEVIVIHHRHKRSNDTRTNRNTFNSTKENKLVLDLENTGKLYPLSGIQEKPESDYDIVDLQSKEVDGVVSSFPPIPSPSPPPISNGLNHMENCDIVESSQRSVNDDLKDLWQKAEAVMVMRNDRVRTILEEFGIGEPGGGGGEEQYDWEDEDVEERKKEEEDVWQIVQENFQV